MDASGIPEHRHIGPRAKRGFYVVQDWYGTVLQCYSDESFVTHGKPNPEIYLKVAQALEIAPQQL